MSKRSTTPVIEFEGGAVVGRHLVSYYDAPGSGGALDSVGGISYNSGAVREPIDNPSDIGGLRRITLPSGENAQIKDWGKDNQAPLRLDEAIAANHVLPSLLDTKRKLIYGQRIYMYHERYEKDAKGKMRLIQDEVQKPAEIEDFIDACEEEQYFQMVIGQLVKNGNIITEFLTSRAPSVSGTTISALKAQESKFWRKEKMDSFGKVKNAYFKGDAWSKKSRSNDFEIRKSPMWAGYNDTDTENNFVYWTGDRMFCQDDYYFSTIWKGSLPWAGLMNVIPVFHDSNLKHRYMTSFHIRLRKGMFLDPRYYKTQDPEEKKKYINEEAAARSAWLGEANSVLAGVENAGRAIWSEEEHLSNVQKQFPDVEIIPLKIDMKDEALLKLYETATKAVMSSVQMHPTLANVETAGKLSSGSEMRNATLMQRILHTPLPRHITMEGFTIAIKVNKWDVKYADKGRKPKFGFHDEDIVALSEDKTGSKPNDNSQN
jgi:hypothetical protein